jgi:dolichol-phosphate mannosyltransferase
VLSLQAYAATIAIPLLLFALAERERQTGDTRLRRNEERLSMSLAVSRLARAARRRPPVVVAGATVTTTTISVVIPARDEAARIGPLLRRCAATRRWPRSWSDDESSDGTAEVAAGSAPRCSWRAAPRGLGGQALGARPRPAGGHRRVGGTMDADVEPAQGLPGALVERAARDGWIW